MSLAQRETVLTNNITINLGRIGIPDIDIHTLGKAQTISETNKGSKLRLNRNSQLYHIYNPDTKGALSQHLSFLHCGGGNFS